MRLSHALAIEQYEQTATGLSLKGIQGEQLYIDVLENDLFRIRLYPDGQSRLDRSWIIPNAKGEYPREGVKRDEMAFFSRPACDVEINSDFLLFKTPLINLQVFLKPFRLAWQSAEGGDFAADIATNPYPYDKSGRSVFHFLQRHEEEHYYGLGERSGELDKYGGRFILKNVDAYGYNAQTSDPLYKHFPFYISYRADLKLAYGLLYDNFATSTFDFGREIDAYHGYYRSYQAADGDLDYYLIYGPTIPEVVQKLARITGKIPLPPRWSLGYLGSTMVYTEAENAQEQLKNFADLCQTHEIPCDLFHLSSGYTVGENDGKRYVFNWNRKRVPNPHGMTENFHQHGIHLSANIKPYFLTTHPRYEELLNLGAFIQSADSDSPELATLWSGGIGESNDGAYLDFTNPVGFDWWKNQVKAQLLEYGIDSTWNDNNEFELWDDAAKCAGFGDELPLGLARPIQTLMMIRSSHQAQTEFTPDLRPFVLTRAGIIGMQRYAQTWSGDNSTSWNSLKYNIPMGLGMSLSGMPNIGHDVGGFQGEKPDPELFIRWLQNGIFHPRFTIHSYNSDGSVNEPWMYPEYLPLVRQIIQFRYRLIPFLYSLFVHSHRTGEPIIRPMVYHFPDECPTESFDFMLGDSLLVASVYEEGAMLREVYLPQGDWCDFYTGEWYSGGQRIMLDAPLEKMPLMVRAGGIIPFGKPMQYIGAEADDLRQVFLFPKNGESEFILVEDDGLTIHSPQTDVKISMNATPEAIHISVSKTGDFPLPYHQLTCILPVFESREIITDGVVEMVNGLKQIVIQL